MAQNAIGGANLGELVQRAVITPPRKRKPVNGQMVRNTREILNRWFAEEGFDPAEIQPSEMDKLEFWVAAYGYNRANPELCDKPKVGLLLCGACGRGKTMLARILAKQFKLPIFTADEIDKEVTETESMPYFRSKKIHSPSCDIVIDDLGAESLRRKYGNEPEFMQFLQRLYEQVKYHGKTVIVTSNFGFSQNTIGFFRDRYGERITDRLVEILMPVGFNGKTNWRYLQHER